MRIASIWCLALFKYLKRSIRFSFGSVYAALDLAHDFFSISLKLDMQDQFTFTW